MNASTHFVGGALAGLAAASVVSPTLAVIVVATATLTAPLPDIDHPGSTYGRWTPTRCYPDVRAHRALQVGPSG